MSRVTSETMTITINGVDYSTYIESVNVSGGTPLYSFTKVYNGRQKRSVTGYNNWAIEISMLVDTATESFIEGLTEPTTTYAFTIGDSASIQKSYDNLYFNEAGSTVTSSDGLEIMTISFEGEGLPSNRT